MQPIKIGLTGKARSGKDTVADHLVLWGFSRVAFGDSLKHYLSEIFPDLISGNKPRALLQRFGQSMREFDEDVWIKHALNKVDESSNVVITDVRQPNEYRSLKERGYVIIRVESSTQNRFNRMMALGDVFSESDLTDGTETALDDYDVDYTIINDGDMSSLTEQITAILAEL